MMANVSRIKSWILALLLMNQSAEIKLWANINIVYSGEDFAAPFLEWDNFGTTLKHYQPLMIFFHDMFGSKSLRLGA